MKLVIAEDHLMVREALVVALQKELQPEVIVQARDYDELLKGLKGWRDADILLVDFYMPGMEGIKGIKLLTSRAPKVRVVVMSGKVSRETANACLEAGAVGYVPKTVSTHYLCDGLRRVAKGGAFIPFDQILEAEAQARSAGDFPSQTALQAKGSDKLDPSKAGLTPREYEVLLLVAQGLANKDIAFELGIELSTTTRHVTRILRALKAKNRTDAVRKARQMGLPLSD